MSEVQFPKQFEKLLGVFSVVVVVFIITLPAFNYVSKVYCFNRLIF